MSVDMARDIPQQLSLETAAAQMTTYGWSDQGFREGRSDKSQVPSTKDGSSPLALDSLPLGTSVLSLWPVELTPAPEPEQFTRLVKQMAEASRDARRSRSRSTGSPPKRPTSGPKTAARGSTFRWAGPEPRSCSI